ncbi:unnamed protein product [Ixodes hexagonus]
MEEECYKTNLQRGKKIFRAIYTAQNEFVVGARGRRGSRGRPSRRRRRTLSVVRRRFNAFLHAHAAAAAAAQVRLLRGAAAVI